ncbi:MAG: SGNH/GDSL hydrolase family protein [Fimbriimonadaceae bacterium]|nr:SGNH/GDSL hydrolase family protein [Fimbriimonadaceae bacterium]
MRSLRALPTLASALAAVACAQTPLATNHQPPVVLHKGDRLAVIGDSITEQKLYSRFIEEYLTLCRPDLGVEVRQLGWSGETATGFANRMQQDCLQFRPTVATTCYGMNDHGYRKYEKSIGDLYRTKMSQILDAFAKAGVRVVVGSPGIVGKKPGWVKGGGSIEDMNDGLAHLHNIGLELAMKRKLGFAEVYQAMVTLRDKAKAVYGDKLEASGADGVHPGAAGHLAMAYAFLKALGMGQTDLARYTIDLSTKTFTATAGHRLTGRDGDTYKIRSTQYPFVLRDDNNPTNSSLAAARFIPWNQDLNRFILVVTGGHAARYKVTWGSQSKTYARATLARGINLAAEFPTNPFSDAFNTCGKAIGEKQAYETKQIKSIFRQPDFKTNEAAVVKRTEITREAYIERVQSLRVPVEHTLKVTPA